MKNATLLLLVAIPAFTYGQKCRFTVDSKDAFTGEKVNSIAHANSGWTWNSIKQGSQYFVEMGFNHVGELEDPMTPGDTVLIKLADGTILKFNPVADALPAHNAQSTTSSTGSGSSYSRISSRSTSTTNTMTYSTFYPRFAVTREIFTKLSQSGITAIRMDFTGKPIDLDFTTKPLIKSTAKLMEDAKCILSVE